MTPLEALLSEIETEIDVSAPFEKGTKHYEDCSTFLRNRCKLLVSIIKMQDEELFRIGIAFGLSTSEIEAKFDSDIAREMILLQNSARKCRKEIAELIESEMKK